MKAVLAVLLLTLSSTQAFRLSLINEWDLRKDFTIARAVFQGFNQGFYENDSFQLNDQCLGEPTVRSILTLDQVIQNADFLKLLDVLTSTYTIVSSTDRFCETESIAYDVSAFCYTHSCDFYTVAQNGLKNLFKIFSAINNAASQWATPVPDDDLDAIFKSCNGSGRDIGRLVRYLLDFDPASV